VATSFFGGAFFGGEFFSSGSVAATPEVGGVHSGRGRPWEQKWRQDLVDLLERRELEKPEPVPPRVKKAIERVLEAEPQDDRSAIQALRSELDKLRVKPRYVEALRYEIAKQYQEQMRREAMRREVLELDDEEVIFLTLH
jgi:hypothetical protein